MQNTRKVTDDIVWVGCNDRRLTLFENLFPIPRGVSYNSYLVMDEKVTLLDTVDVCALQQFMENIDYVLDGKEIDYLIVQHMEPDHGAGIQEMMRRFPNMKIVANAKTIQMIGQFFDLPQEDRVVLVKEGDTLTTGTHTFRFVMAPMVHWPEDVYKRQQYDLHGRFLRSILIHGFLKHHILQYGGFLFQPVFLPVHLLPVRYVRTQNHKS